MRIAFLAAANSIHTIKWVNEMTYRGHEVHLISMHPEYEKLNEKIHKYLLPFSAPFGYYLNVMAVKNLLKKIKPDLLHSHYASGYGTLGRLSGFHPNLLSVWGSDVFDFPYESGLLMKIVKNNLEQADHIASTSWVMKRQVELISETNKKITVTPFGVDCTVFSPQPKKNGSKKLRIGTVKLMAPIYGISYLIEAFAVAKSQGLNNAELYLVGSGPQEEELKELTVKLNIQDLVKFIGQVPHFEVPKWLNSFDVYVALSTMESFGVAVIEASACGLPVVVSDAGGLPEVVINNVTGFIVPKKDVAAASNKILELANNPFLRSQMGQKGREYVLQNYEWSKNADLMEQLYIKITNQYLT